MQLRRSYKKYQIARRNYKKARKTKAGEWRDEFIERLAEERATKNNTSKETEKKILLQIKKTKENSNKC